MTSTLRSRSLRSADLQQEATPDRATTMTAPFQLPPLVEIHLVLLSVGIFGALDCQTPTPEPSHPWSPVSSQLSQRNAGLPCSSLQRGDLIRNTQRQAPKNLTTNSPMQRVPSGEL